MSGSGYHRNKKNVRIEEYVITYWTDSDISTMVVVTMATRKISEHRIITMKKTIQKIMLICNVIQFRLFQMKDISDAVTYCLFWWIYISILLILLQGRGSQNSPVAGTSSQYNGGNIIFWFRTNILVYKQ